jgi:hypothetical protein
LEREHEVLLSDGETVYKQLLKSGLSSLLGVQQPQPLAHHIEPASPLMMPPSLQSGNYRFFTPPVLSAVSVGSILMPRQVVGALSMPYVPQPAMEEQYRAYKHVPDPNMLKFESLLQGKTNRTPTDLEVSACRTGDEGLQISQAMVASH